METEDFAVNRVGLDVIGNHLEGVGMHEERVALRVIDGHGTIGAERKTSALPVFAVVAGKLVLVYRIDVNHIAEGLRKTVFAVVVNAVAHHHLALVRHNRAVHQSGAVVLGVVISLLRVDMTIARGDV